MSPQEVRFRFIPKFGYIRIWLQQCYCVARLDEFGKISQCDQIIRDWALGMDYEDVLKICKDRGWVTEPVLGPSARVPVPVTPKSTEQVVFVAM